MPIFQFRSVECNLARHFGEIRFYLGNQSAGVPFLCAWYRTLSIQNFRLTIILAKVFEIQVWIGDVMQNKENCTKTRQTVSPVQQICCTIAGSVAGFGWANRFSRTRLRHEACQP